MRRIYTYTHIFLYIYINRDSAMCQLCRYAICTKHIDPTPIPYITPYTLIRTGWQRPIQCLIFTRQFHRKSPMISGSFPERDRQLKEPHPSTILYATLQHLTSVWNSTSSHEKGIIQKENFKERSV